MTFLFVAKCHQWIHFCCSARREIARQECHRGNDQRNHHERWSICRADAVEQSRYQPGQRESPHCPERNTNERQNESLAHHELEHVASLRAERTAYSDFTLSLRHRRIYDAKPTDHREQERDCREDPKQRGIEPLSCH